MKTVILWGVLAKQLGLIASAGVFWYAAATLLGLSTIWGAAGAVLIGVLASELGLRLFGNPFRVDFD